MRKTAAAITLITALLITATAGTLLVRLVKANPYHYEEEPREIFPPYDAIPPAVEISTPENGSIFISRNVTLTFKAAISVPTLPELWFYNLYVDNIYYRASWLPNNTYLDLQTIEDSIPQRTRIFSNDSLAIYKTNWLLSGYELSPQFSINLEGIPEGYHQIDVFATMIGSRKTSESPSFGGTILVKYGNYRLVGSSMISFEIDSPFILSPQNKTYDNGTIPLNYTVNNSFSNVSYSLDVQPNILVSGNTTLTSLPDGEHNVTVYATDREGNFGSSEPVIFTVAKQPESLPTVPVAPASVAVVATACAGLLLLYRRKRRREAVRA